MAETFRTAKLEKFIQKQITFMESQERTIELLVREHGEELSDEILDSIRLNQHAYFVYTNELCEEFNIEKPEYLNQTFEEHL